MMCVVFLLSAQSVVSQPARVRVVVVLCFFCILSMGSVYLRACFMCAAHCVLCVLCCECALCVPRCA